MVDPDPGLVLLNLHFNIIDFCWKFLFQYLLKLFNDK